MQDFLFVQGFIRLAGSLLSKPGLEVKDVATLAAGVGTLGQELDWFQVRAAWVRDLVLTLFNA